VSSSASRPKRLAGVRRSAQTLGCTVVAPQQLAALIKQLQEVRDSYVSAYPHQRYGIAIQRINYPEAEPNVLVTHVSSVEGLARSLVMHKRSASRSDLPRLYPRFKTREAASLVKEYVELVGKEPGDYFGQDVWAGFKLAVSWRNLIVHECTYLGTSDFSPLVHCCNEVLEGLVKLSGIRRRAGAT
jgi:hypothetical protein